MLSFRLSLLFIGALLLINATATAQQHIPTNPAGIRGGISGFWFNPSQPAHGVQLEVLNNGRALVSWFTYRRDGSPLWLIGEGSIAGNQIRSHLMIFTGGRPKTQYFSSINK